MLERTDPLQTADASPNLRAMGFGDLLDTTFSCYRTHFWSFLGIATLYFIAMLIGVSISFLDDSIEKSTRTMIWVFTIGALLCVSIFVISALVCASVQASLNGQVSIGTALKQAKRQFFRCLVSSFIFGLTTFLTTFLVSLVTGALFGNYFGTFVPEDIFSVIARLIVLLIMFGAAAAFVTYWCFYISALFVEDISTLGELRRSRELIRGRWWRINGTMLAIFLLHFGMSFILRSAIAIPLALTEITEMGEFFGTVQWMAFFQLPTHLTEFHLLSALMHLVNLGIDMFTMPIWVIGCTLLYFDQRIRKEGFDIEVMATRQSE